jgi:hypothetical protein
MTPDPECIQTLLIELMDQNAGLTIVQARYYAISIIRAEQTEDFERMITMQQEALYGPGERESAA